MRPVAEEFVGNYVKAIHDFHSGLPGELTLAQGDIFKVTSVVDKNWLHGRNREEEGNFPVDFVEKINMPNVDSNQKVFAAVENFPALQDGDLEFRKGCIIVGIQQIDSNWWQGKIGGNVGIFPLTHVMELETSKLLRNRSRSVHASEPLFAQALCDSVAQLDEELGFRAGDIITVTEVIDEDWYQGEVHGKSGMFLASCVQLLNETENDNDNDNTGKRYNHSFINNVANENRNIQTNNFTENRDSGRTELETVNNTNSSIYSDEFQRERSTSYTSENTKSHNENDAGVTPYARTLYPFEGELANELSFDANDIVTLIQHIDEQWIEGELDGRIGLFPASYVEIVVDCPYAYTDAHLDIENQISDLNNQINAGFDDQSDVLNSEAEGLQADPSDMHGGYKSKIGLSETGEIVEEHFALVLYSFDAETNQDLSVTEGETVNVIKQVDDNWIVVENEQGNRGMCPVSFIEIIGAIPEFTHTAQFENGNELKPSEEQSNAQSLLVNRSKQESAKIDLSHQEEPKQSCAIKTSQSLDSIHTVQATSVKAKAGAKPPLKPKPLLAPKPTTKQKPPVSPRSSRKTAISTEESSSFFPKSESSSSLSGRDKHVLQDSQPGLTKSNSMIEISKSETDTIAHTNIDKADINDVHSGNVSSLPASDDANISQKPDSKKAFENWDINQPIESFIQNEFLKAAESRSRSGSSRSTSSADSMNRSGSFEAKSTDGLASKASVRSGHRPVSWAVGSASVDMAPLKPQAGPNYSRSNFYGGSDLSVGNSTFFVNDPQIPKMREPPPTPFGKENVQHRRPSLKKAAPPRPTGPRIAPAPSRVPLTPVKAHNKPVPARPAPAKPQQTPARPGGQQRKHVRPAPPTPQAGKGRPVKVPRQKSKAEQDHLISFSPTNTSVDFSDAVDSEAVVELKSRIAEMEKDLENCKKSKKELEMMEQNVQDSDTAEIHDNIQFYADNIQGITKELETLKDNLTHMCPKEMDRLAQEKAEQHRKMEEERKREEMRQKLEQQKRERKEKREKVIEELVQTEKDFLTSLSLIMETFLSPATEKHADVDIEQLFGNIEEVADVSQRLLTKLEEALNGKDFDQQIIGTCFINLAEDMKNVYAPYCRNHDDVITLIEKYNQNVDIKEYLERLLDELRERHVVFDLEALLIKPVQRILKYPLLLNALIKATEDSHPDKVEILQAINAMTDVATAINEYKRRKDLVYKYKKDTDASLGDKLSKLSLHSIKKKSSRIKERFSVNLGFIDQLRDEQFDREETSYRSLEKIVRVFVKDIQNYMDQVTEVINSQECMVADIEDYYLDKRASPELQKYQSCHNRIQGTFLSEFKEEVDDLVLQPLSTLITRFEAPNKVIQKRYHKLLDYGNLNRKAKDDKITERAAQAAKQDYEALNAQLLDELPKFYKLAFQLFKDCVGSVVQAQKMFTDRIVKEMYSMLDIQVLTKEGVIEVFNIKHVTILDRLAMLSFMPKGFSPRVAEQKAEKKSKRSLESQKSSEVVSQIDSQKIFVTQQYPANKLYKVTKTYIAVDMMDISLSEGDVVGVVMDKDPMGNKERWFVDNGAQKGFVPKKVLTFYDPTPPRNPQAPQQYETEPVSPPPAYQSPEHFNQATGQYFTQQPGYQSEDPSTLLAESSPYGYQSKGSVSPNSRMSTGSYQSITNSAILPNLKEDEMDFALDEDMTPAVPEGSGYETGRENPAFTGEEDDLELYYAEYPFTARTNNEISLFEHQVVMVICKHDQEGNLEWWYVDADGTLGYAPATYLKKMDTHGDPT